MKTKNQKDKTITLNKETQMTGQREPLWRREVKSEFRAPHAAPVTMSPMSYKGMKRTHGKNIMACLCHV